MEPSNVTTVPAPGTRLWDREDISNGTFLTTVIPYGCPAGHAFSGKWEATLDNECRWNTEADIAIWDYWLAPPVNMSDDPARELPECVRKCRFFARLDSGPVRRLYLAFCRVRSPSLSELEIK